MEKLGLFFNVQASALGRFAYTAFKQILFSRQNTDTLSLS